MQKLISTVIVKMLILVLIAVSVRGLAASQSASSDPLFSNADDLIGRPVSAIKGYGFSCSEKKSYPSIFDTPEEMKCVLEPVSGTFSEIRVVAVEGIIHEIDFKVRRDSLRVGHLLSSWGTPNARKYDTIVYFYLHGGNVLAVVSHERRYFSPSVRVWKVYFLDVQTHV